MLASHAHRPRMEMISAPLGGSGSGGGGGFVTGHKKIKGHSGKVETPKIL